MKKFFVILLSIMMAAMPAIATPAEGDIFTIEGMVVEIIEGESVLIDTEQYGEVRVNIDENTRLEIYTSADEAENVLAIGDYVFVNYSGIMTRSIPAQIMALSIRCYTLQGTVVEVIKDQNSALVQTDTQGEVYVHLPGAEQPPIVNVDDRIHVYFNGIMTMSMPGQIQAAQVILGGYIQGEVTEIGTDKLIIGLDDAAVQVNFEADMLPEGLAVGDIIRVHYDGRMTRSLPPQISAQRILQLNR